MAKGKKKKKTTTKKYTSKNIKKKITKNKSKNRKKVNNQKRKKNIKPNLIHTLIMDKIKLPKLKEEKNKKEESIKNVKEENVKNSKIKKENQKNIKKKETKTLEKINLDVKKQEEKIEKNKEEVKVEDKNKKKIIKINYKLIFLIILIIIVYILTNYQYGTTIYKSSVTSKNIEIPKFMKLSEECCNYKATFFTFRSLKSLKNEINNIISKYEKIDCDGNNYYYNREEDYTIIEYGFINGKIFNQIYIVYGKGNACSINPTFKKIELLPYDFKIEDAIKDGDLVILENEIKNKDALDKFQEFVEKKIPATLRIVTLSENKDVIITDLEYDKQGKFRVVVDKTRDKNSNESGIIAYKYDKIGIFENKYYVYNKEDYKNGYYLFDNIK